MCLHIHSTPKVNLIVAEDVLSLFSVQRDMACEQYRKLVTDGVTARLWNLPFIEYCASQFWNKSAKQVPSPPLHELV